MAAFYYRVAAQDTDPIRRQIAAVYSWLASLPDEAFTLGRFGDLTEEYLRNNEGLGKAASFVLSQEIEFTYPLTNPATAADVGRLVLVELAVIDVSTPFAQAAARV